MYTSIEVGCNYLNVGKIVPGSAQGSRYSIYMQPRFKVLSSSLRVPGTHVYGSLRPIDTHLLLLVRHSVFLYVENSKWNFQCTLTSWFTNRKIFLTCVGSILWVPGTQIRCLIVTHPQPNLQKQIPIFSVDELKILSLHSHHDLPTEKFQFTVWVPVPQDCTAHFTSLRPIHYSVCVIHSHASVTLVKTLTWALLQIIND